MLRGHVQYHEGICKHARVLYSASSQSVRGSMVGATYSCACYSRMCMEAVEPYCPFCGDVCIPNVEHLMWHCSHFEATKPQIPADRMAQRMAWPWRGARASQVAAITRHFERVGKAIRLGDGFLGQMAEPGSGV